MSSSENRNVRWVHQFVEDAEAAGGPVDVEKVLDDGELAAGGLQPVRAWVRTKQSKAALRQQRYRERQAAQGVQQVTVPAPAGQRDSIKAVAKVLAGGGWRARMILWLVRGATNGNG